MRHVLALERVIFISGFTYLHIKCSARKMNIDLNIIGQLAPNAEALKKGKELVQKGKYHDLHIDVDRTLIWGACAGSGKQPYYCSVDFFNPSIPVARCNCPSRQFPCKHGLGIMLAYHDGHTFTIAPIPKDILSKREKITQKAEQKEKVKENSDVAEPKVKKAPKAATIIKKIQQQLSGIELAHKLLSQIIVNGIGTIEKSVLKTYQLQIKDLGNYYINGIQYAFTDLLLHINQGEASFNTEIVEKINFLSALLKRATAYLNDKMSNPTQDLNTDSEIEEQIGTIWKSADLAQLNLIEKDTTIVQLAFFSYEDSARKEIIETGIWWSMLSQQIYLSKNYRPFKALQYVKEQNSIHGKLVISELCINPGKSNQRIRWEVGDQAFKHVDQADLQAILQSAHAEYGPLIKLVKQQIKEPLMSKKPYYLIKLKDIRLLNGALAVVDQQGEGILLSDDEDWGIHTTTSLKMLLSNNIEEEHALLVYFKHDFDSGMLHAVPLSMVTKDQIIRLKY